MDQTKSISENLKLIFDELSTTRYNKIEKQFLRIKDISFNPRDIQQLQNELSPILDEPDKLIYTQTDISTLDKMNEIISIYEPYLKSTPEQRTAIIIHLKDELIDIRNSIDDHPTYWGRAQLEPIIKNWLKSIENQVELALNGYTLYSTAEDNFMFYSGDNPPSQFAYGHHVIGLFEIEHLERLSEYLPHNIQTITYKLSKNDSYDLYKCAPFVDRITHLGQSHSFELPWDGLNVIDKMTHKTIVWENNYKKED